MGTDTAVDTSFAPIFHRYNGLINYKNEKYARHFQNHQNLTIEKRLNNDIKALYQDNYKTY